MVLKIENNGIIELQKQTLKWTTIYGDQKFFYKEYHKSPTEEVGLISPLNGIINKRLAYHPRTHNISSNIYDPRNKR